MKKPVLYLVIGVLTVTAGIVAYKIMSKGDKKPLPPNQPVPSDPVTGLPAPVYNPFPLHQGSKGDKVKELQVILGMTGSDIDGDFGPKTLAALQKFGYTSIANQDELDALKTKVNALKVAAGKNTRAQDLWGSYKQDPNTRLMVLIKNTVTQVVKRESGTNTVWERTGKAYVFNFTGKTYSRGDLELYGIGTQGNLVLHDKDGYYLADPNSWTVVTP